MLDQVATLKLGLFDKTCAGRMTDLPDHPLRRFTPTLIFLENMEDSLGGLDQLQPVETSLWPPLRP